MRRRGLTSFIKYATSTTRHPGGRRERVRHPVVWTLAHRGYSGCGRLDLWAYPTQAEALYEGAKLALACGLDEDDHATMLFGDQRYAAVLDYYEPTHPEKFVLRVLPAYLQINEPTR